MVPAATVRPDVTRRVVLLCFLGILAEGYDVGVMGAILPTLATDPHWRLSPLELGTLTSYALLGMLVGGALCVIVLFLRRFLPESPRWLMIKGRNEEAEAIVAGARAELGDLPTPTDFSNLEGRGVQGVVDGRLAVIGRETMLEEWSLNMPEALARAKEQAESDGETAVVVAWDGAVGGVLTVADAVKETSAEAIRQFRDLGLTPVLLTGDLAHFRENYEGNGVPVFNTDRAATLARRRRQRRPSVAAIPARSRC